MKKVGYCLYVHKTNLAELDQYLYKNMTQSQYLKTFRFISDAMVKCSLDYPDVSIDVIKYDMKTGNASFISCPTFDILPEPIVGYSICYRNDGKFTNRLIEGGTKVYHNKWSFVLGNYQGFDIEEAKERTKMLESIQEIKDNKSRIGNINYWYELLHKYGIPVQ